MRRGFKQILQAFYMSSCILAAVPVTCNSIFAKKSAQATDDGYEWIEVSGSNIRQRVKKGSVPANTAAEDSMLQEQFRKVTQKNTSTQHLNGGQ
jgi:hypothetical protein